MTFSSDQDTAAKAALHTMSGLIRQILMDNMYKHIPFDKASRSVATQRLVWTCQKILSKRLIEDYLIKFTTLIKIIKTKLI